MKNIFKIITSLFIILTISTNISYASNFTESNNYDNFIIEFIEETKGNFDECTWNDGFNIDNIIELYGLDENINGYIYEISSNENKAGFVEINVITGQPIVAGFAFNDEHAVNKMLDSSKINQIDDKIYDMGNYNYLVKERNTALNESDTLYNLRTGEKVESLTELKKQYNELLQTMKNNLENEFSQTNYRAAATATEVKKYVTNANYDILVETKDFSGLYIGSWKVNNHCGPTAATNIVKYWAKKRGVSNLYYSDDVWVFKSLCVNMKTNINNTTTIDNAYDGLWSYAQNTRGVTPRSGDIDIYPDYSKTKSLIDKNFPFMLGLKDYDGTTGGHIVACFGYYENNGINQLIINDGWSKTWVFRPFNSLNIIFYSYAEWTGK
jgi:ElaB/YqjD/DUF883 family membrane-anchored ribosome-binding protein